MFRPIVIAMFIVGAMLGGIYGLAVGKFHVFPHDHIKNAFGSLKRLSKREQAYDSTQSSLKGASINKIDTTLLMLNVAELRAPEDIEDLRGGGITSLGNNALIVTNEGEILIFDGETLTHSKIEAPDNGYEAYVRTAETKYSDYLHKHNRLRFNDLLFLDDGNNSRLAISYVKWHDDTECYVNAVSLIPLPTGNSNLKEITVNASDWKEIYQSHPCLQMRHDVKKGITGHMMGGRLAAMSRGEIAIVNGEGNSRFLPQDDGSDMGRVVIIPLDGSPARAINKGLRNPMGLLHDSQGRLWSTEHGPYGGDELNLIQEGKNYGWPFAAYGVEYQRIPIGTVTEYGRHPNSQKPAFSWVPSIAPSNLIEVKDFDSAWEGDLIVATLKSKTLYRLRLDGDRVVYSEPIKIGVGVRYLQMHSNNQILGWTDNATLLVITASPMVSSDATLDLVFGGLDLTNTLEEKVRGAIQSCLECHTAVAGGYAEDAPSLSGIGRRDIASGDYKGYSTALSSMGGSWTKEKLSRYLVDPQGFAPGTKMPRMGLKNDEVTEALAQVLMTLP